MTEETARMWLVALAGAIALAGLLAWLSEVSWASPGPPVQPPGPSGPAPWEVSQVIEEARRITREATE